MEAGRFIKDLLYQADKVHLPGLGTFISNYQNSKTDFSGKKISPPVKSFQFDDSQKEDDELMWGWISEQEGYSESESKMLVADFVADVNHEIHEGREVIIEGLGTFYADVTGKTEFHFSVENNFNAESIGFTDIELPGQEHDGFQVASEPVIHTEEHRAEEKKEPKAEPTFHEIHIEPAHSEVQPAVLITRKSHRAVWIFVIIILCLSALTFLAYKERKELSELAQNLLHRSKTNAIDTLSKKQIPDTGLEKNLTDQAKMKKALDLQESDSSQTFIPYGNRHMKFYIVSASFTNYEHAIKLKNDLRTKGFDSEIITVTHKYYKVTMGSYADKQQAQVELEKFKTITRNNSLWLLHI